MIRTQIQIPTDLYNRAKQLSKEREVPLADLIRKGLEIIVDGSALRQSVKVWNPPILKNRGWKIKSQEELQEILMKDRK
jgi:hypothetical protein